MDRSGSMAPLANAATEGLHEFLVAQEAVEGDTYVTLVEFDTTITTVHAGAKLPVTKWICNPGGGTRLVDALGSTVDTVRREILTSDTRPERVLVYVNTDGQENASMQWTTAQVKVIVEEMQGLGWDFVFVGAGINAWDQAAGLGFKAANTISHAADSDTLYHNHAHVSAAYAGSRTTNTVADMSGIAGSHANQDENNS